MAAQGVTTGTTPLGETPADDPVMSETEDEEVPKKPNNKGQWRHKFLWHNKCIIHVRPPPEADEDDITLGFLVQAGLVHTTLFKVVCTQEAYMNLPDIVKSSPSFAYGFQNWVMHFTEAAYDITSDPFAKSLTLAKRGDTNQWWPLDKFKKVAAGIVLGKGAVTSGEVTELFGDSTVGTVSAQKRKIKKIDEAERNAVIDMTQDDVSATSGRVVRREPALNTYFGGISDNSFYMQEGDIDPRFFLVRWSFEKARELRDKVAKIAIPDGIKLNKVFFSWLEDLETIPVDKSIVLRENLKPVIRNNVLGKWYTPVQLIAIARYNVDMQEKKTAENVSSPLPSSVSDVGGADPSGADADPSGADANAAAGGAGGGVAAGGAGGGEPFRGAGWGAGGEDEEMGAAAVGAVKAGNTASTIVVAGSSELPSPPVLLPKKTAMKDITVSEQDKYPLPSIDDYSLTAVKSKHPSWSFTNVLTYSSRVSGALSAFKEIEVYKKSYLSMLSEAHSNLELALRTDDIEGSVPSPAQRRRIGD